MTRPLSLLTLLRKEGEAAPTASGPTVDSVHVIAPLNSKPRRKKRKPEPDPTPAVHLSLFKAWKPDQKRQPKGSDKGGEFAASAVSTGVPFTATLHRGIRSEADTRRMARAASQYAEGEHWTPDTAVAQSYGDSVHTQQITLQNPRVWNVPGKRAYFQEMRAEFGSSDPATVTATLKAAGHDGLVVRNVPVNRDGVASHTTEVIAFKAHLGSFNTGLSLVKAWNPHQPREPKGGPKGGEFKGEGGGAKGGKPGQVYAMGQGWHTPASKPSSVNSGKFSSQSYFPGLPAKSGPPQPKSAPQQAKWWQSAGDHSLFGSWGKPGGGAPMPPSPNAKPHPSLNDKGHPVSINSPTKASGAATWADPAALATFTPGSETPGTLHGVAMAPWAGAPTTIEGWAAVAGQDPLVDAHMPFVPHPTKHAGAGVIIQEPDGRVWMTKPTNGFGGYVNSFPKGTVEGGMNLQSSAIKEAYEETGMQVRITGVLGDYERDTSKARYYLAERVGGTPAAMGWESQALRLAPLDIASKLANRSVDKKIVADLAALTHVGKANSNPTQERWPKGSPLGGQWRKVGGDGLSVPPTIAGGLTGGNKAYQAKVNALHAAVLAGTATAAQVKATADQWAIKAQPYFAGNKVSSHPKYNAQAAQFAYQLALDMQALPKATAAAFVITGPPPLSSFGASTGGKPGGSNPGGMYGDWLVKGNAKLQQGAVTAQQSIDRAKNEVLAAELLNAVHPGSAPEMKLVDLGTSYGGGLGVASKMMAGVTALKPNNPMHLALAGEHFAAQAWLGNYDAIGLSHDNTMLQNGHAVNIDTGGALLFRAQGLPKDAGTFGPSAKEWDTLRDKKVNATAASVYGQMTQSELQSSAKALAALPDETITKLTMAHGPGGEFQRADLAKTLIARKADVLKRAGLDNAGNVLAAPAPPPPPVVTAPPAPVVAPAPAAATPPSPYALTLPQAMASLPQGWAHIAAQKWDKPDGSPLGLLIQHAKSGDYAAAEAISWAGLANPNIKQGILDGMNLKAGMAGTLAGDPAAAAALHFPGAPVTAAPPAPPPASTGKTPFKAINPNSAAAMHMPEALDHTPDASKATLAASWNITGTVYGNLAHAVQTGDIDALKAVKVWTDGGIAAQMALLTAMEDKAAAAAKATPPAAPAAAPPPPPAPTKVAPALPDPAKYLTTSVGNPGHNPKIAQMTALAAAGDVKGLLGMPYGTNTYGKKQAAYANDLLAALGSIAVVHPGQKAGTHAWLAPGAITVPPTKAAAVTVSAPPPAPAAPPKPTGPVKITDAILPTMPVHTGSSKAHVNQANDMAVKRIHDLAMTGDLVALKAMTFDVIDKETGQPTGEKKTFGDHPSKSVQAYFYDAQAAVNDALNPPAPLTFGTVISAANAAEVATAFPAQPYGTTVAKVPKAHQFGFWIALGEVLASAHLMPKKTAHYTADQIQAGYDHYKKMSAATKSFVSNMQSSGSFANAYRNGDSHYGGEDLKKLAQAAFKDSMEMPEGAHVTRWQNMPAHMLDQLKKAPDGVVFQATGPMPTSHKPGGVSGFGKHKVNIFYAKGARAVPSYGSGSFTGEKEVTTLPGSRFVLLSKKQSGSGGSWELNVLMLPPDPNYFK